MKKLILKLKLKLDSTSSAGSFDDASEDELISSDLNACVANKRLKRESQLGSVVESKAITSDKIKSSFGGGAGIGPEKSMMNPFQES